MRETTLLLLSHAVLELVLELISSSASTLLRASDFSQGNCGVIEASEERCGPFGSLTLLHKMRSNNNNMGGRSTLINVLSSTVEIWRRRYWANP